MAEAPPDGWLGRPGLAALIGAAGQAFFRAGADWSALSPLPADGGPPGAAEPLDRWLARRVPPEDREELGAAIAAAVGSGAPLAVEHRACRDDGGLGWAQLRAAPVPGPDGAVAAWMVATLDVTDRREALAQHRLHLAELQHRVRNTLAVIRSVVRRSADGSRGAGDYATRLEGRIGAIARAQGAAIRGLGAAIELEELLRDELLAAAVPAARVRIDGPSVRLRAQAAEALALAFHELAMSAITHGALAAPEGRVEVEWRVEGMDGDRRLLLAWSERGGPVKGKARRGLGPELLERPLGYALGARTSLERRPGGLVCRIELPLAGAGARPGPDGAAAGLLAGAPGDGDRPPGREA